jgi:hypothetical protein
VSVHDPNPQHAVRSAANGLFRAQNQIAERIAGAIERTPRAGLEALMRTPARGPLLAAIFGQMSRRIDPKRAARLEAVVRWHIVGEAGDEHVDTFDLVLAGGNSRIVRPSSDPTNARLTITVTAVDLVRLATGNSDALDAFFRGRVRLRGDFLLAARLAALFRS